MQSQISKNSQRTKRLAISSMFACLALIFSYVEAIIPFNAGIPGVKLGIANLVVIIALYEMNFRYAFAINALRILISGPAFQRGFRSPLLSGGRISQSLRHVAAQEDRPVQHDRREHGRRCSPQHGSASRSCPGRL